MTEREIQTEIRNDLAGKCLTFRANVGQAWAGSRTERLSAGRMLIHDARPFSTGLPPGFSDLFGLVPVTITPDMVGRTVGVFFGLEVKTPTGRLSDKQGAFLSAITAKGGIGEIVRSGADALAALKL